MDPVRPVGHVPARGQLLRQTGPGRVRGPGPHGQRRRGRGRAVAPPHGAARAALRGRAGPARHRHPRGLGGPAHSAREVPEGAARHHPNGADPEQPLQRPVGRAEHHESVHPELARPALLSAAGVCYLRPPLPFPVSNPHSSVAFRGLPVQGHPGDMLGGVLSPVLAVGRGVVLRWAELERPTAKEPPPPPQRMMCWMKVTRNPGIVSWAQIQTPGHVRCLCLMPR